MEGCETVKEGDADSFTESSRNGKFFGGVEKN